MAETSVLREFLVDLGFRVDAASEAKFREAADSANKRIGEFAHTLSVAGAGLAALLTKVGANLSQLDVTSKRVGASADNIKAFQYAIEQMGGSADGALQSLESLAQKFRESPGYYRALEQLGIQTKDANGNLRDSVDMVTELGQVLAKMPMHQAKAYANMFGIDERTLLALRDPQTMAVMKEYQDLQAKMGVDQSRAAASSRELTQELNKLYATLNLALVGITGELAGGLTPAVQALNEGLQQTATWFNGLDPEIQSAIKIAAVATAGFIALAGSLKAVSTAWNIVKGIGALGAGGAAAGGAAPGAAAGGGIMAGIAGIASRLGIPLYLLTRSDSLNAGEDEWARKNRGSWKKGGAVPPAVTSVQQSAGTAYDKAVMTFIGMGWSKEQAAGIVANLKHESALNPRAVGDGGQAYGIAQWHSDRQANFARWAGKNIRQSTLEEQLKFIHYELTQGAERKAGDMLRMAKNAVEAGQVVSQYYERPLRREQEAAARGETSAQIHQSTTITVNGATDPRAIARAIGDEQRSVNNDMARNFKITAR